MGKGDGNGRGQHEPCCKNEPATDATARHREVELRSTAGAEQGQ